MKIFYNNEMLDIPIWITASDNSVQIANHTAKINDRHGEVSFGEHVYSARSFNCSGTIFAEKYEDVEKERSRLTSLLVGRELKVYRDDDDKIFYICCLIGNIKISYNHGIDLAKTFTISFMLKALDPFGYEEEKEKSIVAGLQTLPIQNDGNYMTIPIIEINTTETLNGLLLKCDNSFLELSEEIILTSGQILKYQDGNLFLNNDDISHKLSDKSLLYPLSLQAGNNNLEIKIHSGNIKIKYHGRYV